MQRKRYDTHKLTARNASIADFNEFHKLITCRCNANLSTTINISEEYVVIKALLNMKSETLI